ncbi:hypothetical protein [Tsukamurella tyrosinosolvens]|uniref:hypothetical protein n=1 Tax=Tsukamurella tyrosinosolvens TaxID=57704 RepID=UPI003462B816
MMSVEVAPAECERCGSPFGPRRVLVGWDNVHTPPCRSYTCRACGHVEHVEHPRLETRP